jgi:hypothetical protein
MYLYVKNNSDNGIFLMNGSVIKLSTLGRMTINHGGKYYIYEFSPIAMLDYVDLLNLKIGGPTMEPVLVGPIRITNGESHYMTFNMDKTITTNQIPF